MVEFVIYLKMFSRSLHEYMYLCLVILKASDEGSRNSTDIKAKIKSPNIRWRNSLLGTQFGALFSFFRISSMISYIEQINFESFHISLIVWIYWNLS